MPGCRKSLGWCGWLCAVAIIGATRLPAADPATAPAAEPSTADAAPAEGQPDAPQPDADHPPDPEARRRDLIETQQRLEREERQHQAAGDLAAAIACGQQMLAAEIEVLGTDHDNVDSSFHSLAKLSALNGDSAAARKYAEQSLATQSRLHGANGWSTIASRQLLKHVERVAELDDAQRKELNTASVDYQNALDLYGQDKSRDALEVSRRVVSAFQKLLGDQLPATAHGLLQMGYIQMSLGQNAEALLAINQADQIFRQTLTTAHPDMAACLMALADAQWNLGQYAAAATADREAAEIRQKLFGPDNAETRTSLSSLGWALSQAAQQLEERDELAQAKTCRQETLATWKRVYADDDWRVNSARGWLRRLEQLSGLSIDQRKQLAEAARLHVKCSQLYQTSNYDQALESGQQALEIRREVLGSDATDTAMTLNILGLVQSERHDFPRSEAILAEAIEIWRAARGDGHPDFALVVQNLAEVYVENDKLDQAEQLMRQALAIRRRCYGKKHNDTVRSAARLANLLATLAEKRADAGDFAAAKPLRAEVLALRTELKGPDNWQTLEAAWQQKFDQLRSGFTPEQQQQIKDADAMIAQADQFATAKQFGPAIAAVEEAARLRKEAYGEQNLIYGLTLMRSAQFNATQGNSARAAELYGQVRDIIKAELGTDHSLYVSTITDLAGVYQAQKNLTAAVELLREAWQTYSRNFGAGNSTTIQSAKRLLDVLGKLAAAQDAKPDAAGAKKSREEVVAVLTALYGEKNWQVNDARWALYQTGLMPSWRGNQRQQLTQADGLLAQAAQAHQRIKDMDGKFPLPTAEQRSAVAQPGAQAAAQAVTLRKQVLGEAHPSVADALEWQASLERDRGNDSAAQASYEQALAIRKKSQGVLHPSYAKTRESLGRVMALAMAMPFQRPSKLTPAQQQRMVQRDWYDNRTQLLEKQGDMQGAYRSAQAMLQIEREVLGEVHEETALSYEKLAVLAMNLGNSTESRQHRAKTVDIYTKLHGADSWQTNEARHYVNTIDRLTRLNREQLDRVVKAEQVANQVKNSKTVSDEQLPDAVLATSDQVLKVLSDTFGEDSIYTANCLWGKAIAYDNKQDHEKAEDARWQSAEITGRAFGKKHPLYRMRLGNLALQARQDANNAERRADFAAAQKLWNKLIVIQTLHYGADHWQVRKVRQRLALCHKLETMPPADRSAIDRVLRESEFPGGVPLPPRMVGQEELVEDRPVYPLLRQLLGDDSPETMACYHDQALAVRDKGDLSQAVTMLRKSLERCRKIHGSDHPQTARAANDLGLTYFRVGAYVDAEPLLREAREILERLERQNDAVYAASLNNLAMVYEALGDYERAEPLLRRVVTMHASSNEEEADPDDEFALRSAGKYEALMGEFNVAAAFDRLSERYATARPPRQKEFKELAQYVNNLAMLYEARGDMRQAEPLLRQALGLIRITDKEGTSPEYAIGLSNLAVLYEALDNFDRAEMLLERVIEVRKNLSAFDPKYATALNNLGVVLLRRGETERSGELWREAFDKRRQLLGEGNPNTLVSMANLALLAHDTGHSADAARQLDKVLDLANTNLRLAAAIQSERQQLIMRRALRGYLDLFLTISTRTALPAEDVYRHILDWKGAVAADQRRLRELRQLAKSKGNEEIAQLYASLEETTRALATMRFGGSGENEISHKRFQELSVKKDDLERELAQRSRQSGRAVLEPLTVAQLKALLPPKTALVDVIEYAHLPQPGPTGTADKQARAPRQRRLLAFVIRKDRPTVVHELGAADKIDNLVDACRTTWLRGKSSADSNPALELRKAIWEPLVADIAGVETVLVAPDGATARLPLAALPGKEPDTYLIEELSIAVVPAPQLLGELLSAAALRSGSGTPPKMLLVGNVDFGADPGSEPSQRRGGAAPRGGKPSNFGELPATLAEVKAVEQLYQAKFKSGTASLLEQAAATESAVRKQAQSAKYLHLATHGFFAPAEIKSAEAAPGADPLALTTDYAEQTVGWNPGLLTGVALTGVNRPLDGSHDDGILTAAEVADMNLSAAPLVVLSACETGLGQITGGEGMLGLQRAFHVAGASTVVASLWKVDDRATQLLMTEFYDNLWNKNLPPLAAFRTAQLSLLNGKVDVSALRGLDVAGEPADEGAAGQRLSPRLWAAFVLSGSPN